MHLIPRYISLFSILRLIVENGEFSRKMALEKRYLIKEGREASSRSSCERFSESWYLREPFRPLSVENRSSATCRLRSRDRRKFPNATGTGTRASARCQSFVIADQTILVWAKFSDKSAWIASLVVARVSNQTWSAQTFIGQVRLTWIASKENFNETALKTSHSYSCFQTCLWLIT